MTVLPGGFTPMDEENMVIAMDKALFDQALEALMEKKGVEYEVEYGQAIRGTFTYFEPTIYELEPRPDPLSVGQG